MFPCLVYQGEREKEVWKFFSPLSLKGIVGNGDFTFIHNKPELSFHKTFIGETVNMS